MKQEDKELLLKDLCARLPYMPKIQWDCADYDLLALENCEPILARIMDDRPYSCAISKPLEEIKPYLRSMSNMTEEETVQYFKLCYKETRTESVLGYLASNDYYHDTVESIDWLNKKGFDYRGLIEKGLALEAPEGMYK